MGVVIPRVYFFFRKKTLAVTQILLYIRTITEDKNTHTKGKTKQPDKTDRCMQIMYLLYRFQEHSLVYRHHKSPNSENKMA